MLKGPGGSVFQKKILGVHTESVSVFPFLEIYDAETKLILSVDQLSQLFAKTGMDAKKPVVTSCGSGITACNLALALYLTGNSSVAVYDGSWTEWGSRDNTPLG